MRIFNLDTLLSFAFYPDGNKKRHRNSQEYRLNIDQYGRNGSDESDSGTIKKYLKNLKVLCLGVATESESSENKLAYVKLRIEKRKQYKLTKEFQSPNESNPLPFILFYKKKKKAKANLKLIDILSPFFSQTIKNHKEINYLLKQAETLESIANINSDYHNIIIKIANEIFKKLENDRKDLINIGLFIDPYFIRKKNNDLMLFDTRPADTLPRKRKEIRQQPKDCENTILEETVHSNMTDSDSDNESFFLDSLSFEPIENEIMNMSKFKTMDKNEVDTQLDLSNEISNSFIADQAVSVQDQHSFALNFEKKEKIKNLLKEYKEKQLDKGYFFYSPSITKSKQTVIDNLLDNLYHTSSNNFIEQIDQAATKAILNQHRCFFYFPILSYLFNTNTKTKGGLLLESILLNLEENKSIDLSIKH